MTLSIDDYAARFHEEPGYLDFAGVGPIGDTVRQEMEAFASLHEGARFGSYAPIYEQDARVRAAVSTVTGFRADQVVFQPNTSQGLMHALFGITGGVALSPAEFPSLTFATVRAQEALGPDLREVDFLRALRDFSRRQRRFGQ